MIKLDRLSRKQKILVFTVSILLLLLGIGLAGRGWIRSNGAHWVAIVFYRPGVVKKFNSNFTPVHSKLAELGIPITMQDKTTYCAEPSYQGIKISTYCETRAESGKVADSDEFKAKWRTNAPKFEKYLQENGWEKSWVWAPKQNIETLVDDPEPDTVENVSYNTKRDEGGVNCSLRIGYNSYDNEGRRLFFSEHCSREINFFGGYQ